MIFIGGLFLFSCMGYGESPVFYELPSESTPIHQKYKSCKDVDIPSTSSGLEEAVRFLEPQQGAFRNQLKERVIFQIEFKISFIQKIRACITKNRDWFIQRNLDWSVMESICKDEIQELESLMALLHVRV